MNEKSGVRGGPLQVGREARLAVQRRRRHRAGGGAQRDHVRVAVGLVGDHRLEVHERVVAGGVAVAFDRFLGVVLFAESRVPAGRGLAVGVVAHVLHVGLPRPFGGAQLGADVLDRFRVHAADSLPRPLRS